VIGQSTLDFIDRSFMITILCFITESVILVFEITTNIIVVVVKLYPQLKGLVE